MKICPNPLPWNEIHSKLKRYSKKNTCTPSELPIPLILAGSFYSNDIQKKVRWEEMVEWANNNGCQDLVEGIPSDQFYTVIEPSSYSIGPMGGPCYNSWDFETKDRPSFKTIEKNIKTLLEKWSEIVGEDLANMTHPPKFTGDKARRLLVSVDTASSPPWGSWTKLSSNKSERLTFTKFRASINKAISPHEVDHIDFIPGEFYNEQNDLGIMVEDDDECKQCT